MCSFSFLCFPVFFSLPAECPNERRAFKNRKKSTEGAMITTLCHEINNPLSILMMGIQRLKDEGADEKLIGMMERS
jgi:hypothetical protein